MRSDSRADPEEKGKIEDYADLGTQEKEVDALAGHGAGTNDRWRTGTCNSTNRSKKDQQNNSGVQTIFSSFFPFSMGSARGSGCGATNCDTFL